MNPHLRTLHAQRLVAGAAAKQRLIGNQFARFGHYALILFGGVASNNVAASSFSVRAEDGMASA